MTTVLTTPRDANANYSCTGALYGAAALATQHGELLEIKPENKMTLDDLRKKIQDMGDQRPVVVMDEVYYGNTGSRTQENRHSPLIKNVFRAPGIIPILTGTNSAIGSHRTLETAASRGPDQMTKTSPDVLLLIKPVQLKLDCLLRITRTGNLDSLLSGVDKDWSEFLRYALTRGRPLFSRIVAEELFDVKVKKMRGNNAVTAKDMATVFINSIRRLDGQKPTARGPEDGRRGQLCLFLPHHRRRRHQTTTGSTMINAHFANVEGDNRLLLIGNPWVDFATKKTWEPHCHFPDIGIEPLLFMLMASAMNSDVCVFGKTEQGQQMTTLQAMKVVKYPILGRHANTGNPDAETNDGSFLEALAVTAMSIASTQAAPGVGTWWRAFFQRLSRELRPNWSPCPELSLWPDDCSVSINNFFNNNKECVFPYMVPVVNETDGKDVPLLERVWRPPNSAQFDIQTSVRWLSGECKNRSMRTGAKMICENLERLPLDSKVHFVFVKELSQPSKIFNNRNRLWSGVEVSKNHLTSNQPNQAKIKDSIALFRLNVESMMLSWLAQDSRVNADQVECGIPRPKEPTAIVVYVEVGPSLPS